MKKLLFISGLLFFTKCTTAPEPADPKIILFAKSSVVQYLPLHIYLDSSFVGSVTDTIKPFTTEFPPLSEPSLLQINVTPGQHNLTIVSLPAIQDTITDKTNLDNIMDDFTIQPDFHASENINVEMGQYIYQPIGK